MITTKDGPSRIQSPGIPSENHTWTAGVQRVRPSSCAFLGTTTGSWCGSKAAVTLTSTLIQNANIETAQPAVSQL